MTQPHWAAALVRVVAGEVKRHRQAQGMSAQDLADACASMGHPIARSVLANLESGRRETISVPELLVLARALRVPPLLLVFPLGHTAQVEALPGRVLDTWAAAQWFTGEAPFVTEIRPSGAADAADDDFVSWESGPGCAANMYRRHERAVQATVEAQNRARHARLRADTVVPEERDAQNALADSEQRFARITEQTVIDIRAEMQRRGVTPPDLPTWLHVRGEVGE